MFIEKLNNLENEKILIYVNKPELQTKIPLVILLHGFTSKGNNSTNKCLVELLGKFNIATICVDLSGHGDSGGFIEEQTVSKAESEIEIVYEWAYNQNWVDITKISILGNSFSGNAAILFAAKRNCLCSLVLKSPITDYYDVRLRQIGEEKMKKWKNEGKIILPDGTPSNYSFISDLKNFDTYNDIRRIKCPIFVVQGDNDEDIPIEHVLKLKQSLDPNKDFIEIIKGANHGYTDQNHFAKMLELIVSFLKKNLLE